MGLEMAPVKPCIPYFTPDETIGTLTGTARASGLAFSTERNQITCLHKRTFIETTTA